MSNIPASRVQTAAFNVERMRADMLQRVRPPDHLVQEAIDKLHEKLEAKTTKFFTFQGEVQQQVDVEDHDTQLSAADKILSMAGLYATERGVKPTPPTTAVEVDPVTGIVRIVIGAEMPPAPVPVAAPPLASPAPLALAKPIDDASDSTPAEQEYEVIKVRKGGMPARVFDALFGKDDGAGDADGPG